MKICSMIYNFFRLKYNLGKRHASPRELTQYSEENQKKMDKIIADINSMGDKITSEQLKTIFGSRDSK